MNYNDVLTRVTYLTKRNNISQQEFADIFKIKRQSMNAKSSQNAEFSEEEIKAIEQHYNIDLSTVNISICLNKNSKNKKSAKTIKEKLSGFPNRLKEVQITTGLSDKDFAQKIELYRDEYLEFLSGERKPNLKILNSIKQHFDISLDWLLYGE